jgi:hypothetical protein
MSDERTQEREAAQREVDSLLAGLSTAARSRKGRSLLGKAVPWLMAAMTGAVAWAGAKMDSKAEMAKALEVRAELIALKSQQAELLKRLDEQLFATEPGRRGRIVKLERGQYFAWRALSEIRAAAYVDQPERRRRRMDDVGAKFASKFDKRAQDDLPEVAYDELFAQVHVE